MAVIGDQFRDKLVLLLKLGFLLVLCNVKLNTNNLIKAVLPVTLVPMMRGRGISSGRSLQFDTSDSFLCCSRRIFCLFCLSAVRSSAKKADEHLDKTKVHSAVATFSLLFLHITDLWNKKRRRKKKTNHKKTTINKNIICRRTSKVPSGFSHQSPNCPPLYSCKLSCFKIGERLLETQAEFVVTLKKWSEREKETIFLDRNFDQNASYM